MANLSEWLLKVDTGGSIAQLTEFSEKVKKSSSSFNELSNKLLSGKTSFSQLKTEVTNIAGSFEVMETPVGTAIENMTSVSDVIDNAKSKAEEFVNSNETLKNALDATGLSVDDVGNVLKGDFKDVGPKVFESLKTKAIDFVGSNQMVKDALATTGLAMKDVENVMKGDLSTIGPKIFEKVKSEAIEFANNSETLQSALRMTGLSMDDLGNMMKGNFSEAGQKAFDHLKGKANEFVESNAFLKSTFEATGLSVDGLGTMLQNKLQNVDMEKVKTALKGVGDRIRKIHPKAKMMVDGITNAASNVDFDKLKGALTDITSGNDPMGGVKRGLESVGVSMESVSEKAQAVWKNTKLAELMTKKFGTTSVTEVAKILKARGKEIALQIRSIGISKAKNALMIVSNGIKTIATGIQWAMNAAMAVNPVFWIVAGIVALIAVIVIVVKKFKSFSGILSYLKVPFLPLLTMIKMFGKIWDNVVKAFKEGGIVGVLKMIGDTIKNVLFNPIQTIKGWLSDMPLIGSFFGKGDEEEATKKIEGEDYVEEVETNQSNGRSRSVLNIDESTSTETSISAETSINNVAAGGPQEKTVNMNISNLINEMTIKAETITEAYEDIEARVLEKLIKAVSGVQQKPV